MTCRKIVKCRRREMLAWDVCTDRPSVDACKRVAHHPPQTHDHDRQETRKSQEHKWLHQQRLPTPQWFNDASQQKDTRNIAFANVSSWAKCSNASSLWQRNQEPSHVHTAEATTTMTAWYAQTSHAAILPFLKRPQAFWKTSFFGPSLLTARLFAIL